MRIVDLEHHLVGQHIPAGAVGLFKIAHGELHGRGGQEILLLEAQLLALFMVVLGIEHLRDRLDQLLVLGGLHILAAVELLHIERVDRAGRPGAQHIDHIAVIAQHGHIVGHGLHGVVIAQLILHAAVLGIFADIAVKAHLDRLIEPADLPDIAPLQPVVGQLHLEAVGNMLAEQAQLIADGAAHRRQLERGERIEEARGQAAQTAVAQARLRLALKYARLVDAQLVQSLHIFLFIDQRNHVVVHGAAHQKLRREIIELFRLLALAFAAGQSAPLHHFIADGHGQRLI